MGYSIAQQAHRAGINHGSLYRLMHGASATSPRTHNAVHQLFRVLWNTPWQPDTGPLKVSATKTRKHALEQGWPSPVDLDDDGYVIDDDITDADLPIRNGRPPADLDEWLHLVHGGANPNHAARRLGVTLSAIKQAAHRNDRREVLAALKAAA